MAAGVHEVNGRWLVSRVSLHGGEARGVASSASIGKELLVRHAHGQSGSGTIRAAERSGGTVSDGGSDSVQGGRGSCQ